MNKYLYRIVTLYDIYITHKDYSYHKTIEPYYTGFWDRLDTGMRELTMTNEWYRKSYRKYYQLRKDKKNNYE